MFCLGKSGQTGALLSFTLSYLSVSSLGEKLQAYMSPACAYFYSTEIRKKREKGKKGTRPLIVNKVHSLRKREIILTKAQLLSPPLSLSLLTLLWPFLTQGCSGSFLSAPRPGPTKGTFMESLIFQPGGWSAVPAAVIDASGRGPAVLFTQLSGAILGLRDKPNELLCVRVQMSDAESSLHLPPPHLPAPASSSHLPKGQCEGVIRPLNYAQGQKSPRFAS